MNRQERRRAGKADKGLTEKLRAELPGILGWAVRGCLEWQRRGLEPPASIQAATDDYRTESDPLAGFLAEYCVLGDGLASPANPLYKAYARWAADQGYRDRELLTSTAFGRLAGSRFDSGRSRAGKVYYGLGLLNAQQSDLKVTGFTSDDPSLPLNLPMYSPTRDLLENSSQPVTPVTEENELCTQANCDLPGTHAEPTTGELVCLAHFQKLASEVTS